MDTLDVVGHVVNFALPACAVALLLGLTEWRRSGALRAWPARGWQRLLVRVLVGVGALLGGLWFHGVDAKMSSYAALVLATASAQWLMLGSWRK